MQLTIARRRGPPLHGLGALTIATLLAAACGGDSNSSDGSDSADVVADSFDATVDSHADSSPPTEVTPDVTGADEVDTTGPIVCGDFAVSGQLVANDAPGAFTLGGGTDLGFGGPLPDAVVLEFYSNATGTFDLATGGNDNYATCDQCIRIVQDIDPSDASKTRHFFQAGGTMIIDPSTPPEEGRLDVQLVDLKLVEVTIFADYHTEPLDRGACYDGLGSVHLETAACVPACGDHICGPDGCGGECGAGCATGVCTLDGKACEVDPACHVLKLPGGPTLDNKAAGVYRTETTSFGLGAESESDFLQLEFYSRATGNFDLATNEDADHATCKECVRMVLDGKREFFQAGGKLELTAGSDVLGDPGADPPGGALTATLKNVRLIEVTYDEETFHAHPVEGGACIDLVVDAPLEKAP
ncbi:MAG: hypothetical protein U1F43_28440 [Myxococcota bacterium]